MKPVVFVFIFLGLISCSTKSVRTDSPEAAKLNAIIARYSETVKRLDPYYASYFNVEEDLDKFGDYPSQALEDRAKKMYDEALMALKTVNPEALPSKDRRTYLLFSEDMRVSRQAFEFDGKYLELNQMGNRLHSFMDDSSETLTTFPFDSVQHYQAFVKRSQGFPAYVDRQIALLREGMKKKVVLSCDVAKKVNMSYKDALETKVEKNPFYRPIGFMPKTFSAQDQAQLTEDFKKTVANNIIPGYQKFEKFFQKEYVPKCRKSFGIGELPNGKAWYRYAIKANTNLDLSPEEVHAQGLREVARIATGLTKLKDQMGFKGDLKAFIKDLSTNPKYFFKTPKDIFDAFAKTKAEVEKKIPQYFSLIPKGDYKIVESSNPEDASGSYNQPTEMIPYGRFVVNTTNLKAVPIYEVTTLSMHEAVPGHHFQLALQFEMKEELSEYQRKMYGSNSFVEGWALYAEYLGEEMGMYVDPLQKVGNLTDEMLRAVRLVVDTGIHSKGWSQKKAVEYASRYLASDPKEIEVEINRYSVWPGQALGYKIGQLKIIELRRKAEKDMGTCFDIKGFHKAVIGNASVSLNVLEGQVDEWVQAAMKECKN